MIFGSRLILLLLISVTPAWAVPAQGAAAVATAYVDGDKAAVIAFLPSSMQDSQAGAAAEARKHVRAAIAKTKQCLGGDNVSYLTVFAERIVVRWPGHEESFAVGDFAPLLGALLLRPDTSPRIIFAGGGPEALAQMLQSTAGKYFGKRCKVD